MNNALATRGGTGPDHNVVELHVARALDGMGIDVATATVQRREVEDGLRAVGGASCKSGLAQISFEYVDLAADTLQVLARTAGEVIGDGDLCALSDKQLDKMAPNERRTARDQNTFARIGVQGVEYRLHGRASLHCPLM